jgi:hypothetical protein
MGMLAGLPGGLGAPAGRGVPQGGGDGLGDAGLGTGLGGPVAIALGGGGGGAGLLAGPALPGGGAGAGAILAGPGPGAGATPDVRLGLAAGQGPGGLYVGVAGTFDMPIGVTGSDYEADKEGIPNLLAEVRSRTNVHVTVQRRMVPLTPAEVNNTPVIWMTGHKAFSFTPAERATLKQYVAQGGTILAEDCHGAFAECFEREMREIFGKPLRDLPANHEVYRSHYVLGSTPAGDMGERYSLQGVDVGGRLGVIYSRNDYCGCWEGTGGWVKPGSREPAFQIGTNLFVYIVAHWNKRPK